MDSLYRGYVQHPDDEIMPLTVSQMGTRGARREIMTNNDIHVDVTYNFACESISERSAIHIQCCQQQE